MIKCLNKQTLFWVYIVIFVECFMVFIYEPIVMYATNINDFWFDFQIMIAPTLQIFVLFFASVMSLCTLLYFVNKIFDKKAGIYKIVVLIGSLLYFATYIQGNWLVRGLPLLDGSTIVWEQYGKTEDFVMAAAVIVIGALIAGFVRKCGFYLTMKYIARISIIIFVMLSVSLVSVVVSNDALRKKESISFSADN